MNCVEKWKHVAVMVTVQFGLALVQILFKKALNGGMDHLIIVVYRQSISTIFLIPFVYFLERRSWAKLTARLIVQMFFCALLGLTLTQYLFLVGLDYTSATFTCAFINMVPVLTFVLALPLGMERINMKSNNGKAKVLGTLTCVSGSLAWSSWFLAQSKIGHNFPYLYSSTSIMSFFSAIQSAVLCFATDHRSTYSKWILKGDGTVGSGLCYVAMSWCVKQRGPVFTAAFSPLIQIFTAVFDVLVLHEEIYLGSILGSLVVIVGMYVLLWGKSNDEETCNAVPKRTNGCNNGQDSAHEVAS
ncbi:wat1-related protein at3g30340 [Phtheirospermum japonicum]|uniref:WAT1-related protein n=1 Tax=Phtheirospermum japonicum TaxID=374723 RepID=A0A830B3P8_9LAMI|nr:wat1-related protein at3g30340 [Phtheirospermum japonicum]